MKIYCTGASGTLGKALLSLGCEPLKSDVTDFDAIHEEMLSVSPDVVIHLVGLNVDMTEQDYHKAYHVAIQGTANVIDRDMYPLTRFIYISSSHVFDGKRGNYKETDKPKPINDYGLIKLATEGVAKVSGGKIIRLSTCFNENHVDIKELVDNAPFGFPTNVPTFIRRTYAHINHIAEGIMIFANRFDFMPPLLHLSGTEDLSMYEFALAVASHYGWDKRLIEPRKKEINIDGQAKRPYRAGLNTKLALKSGIKLYSALEGVSLL
jgi:dTDP-4-dehydrorhamnose reductase